jgi:hypothetical protein
MGNVLVAIRTTKDAKLGEILGLAHCAARGDALATLDRGDALFVVSRRPGKRLWLIAILERVVVELDSVIVRGRRNTTPTIDVTGTVQLPRSPRVLTAHEVSQLRASFDSAPPMKSLELPAATPLQTRLRFTKRTDITAKTRLTEIDRAQLKAIGRSYFGPGKGDAKIASPNDVGDPMLTRSLMHCTRWKVVDGNKHVYDAWFYMVDSGSIFRAGTATRVASVIQLGLQCSNDKRRAKLGPALIAAKILPENTPSMSTTRK